MQHTDHQQINNCWPTSMPKTLAVRFFQEFFSTDSLLLVVLLSLIWQLVPFLVTATRVPI